MAIVSLGPQPQTLVSGDIILKTLTSVWVKRAWDDPTWTEVAYLRPIHAEEVACPPHSTATFRLDYGRMMREDDDTFRQWYQDFTHLDWFICIRAHPTAFQSYVLWCGILPLAQFDVGGLREVGPPPVQVFPSGQQIFTAHGLSYLLDRRRLTKAAVWMPNNFAKIIGWLPTFNQRGEFALNLIGNRSLEKITVGQDPDADPPVAGDAVSYGFWSDDPGEDQFPKVWSFLDIIEYGLRWSDDFTGNRDPHFKANAPQDLKDFIHTLKDIFDANGKTVWQIIEAIVERKRGLGAKVAWSIDDELLSLDENGQPILDPNGDPISNQNYGFPKGDVSLEIFSVLDVSVTVGSGAAPVVVPRNPNQVELTFSSDLGVANASTILDGQATVDEIEVIGARTLSCFTVDYKLPPVPPAAPESADPAKLVPAWTLADEAAYKAEDDVGREAERYARVFRVFKLAPDFNWIIGDHGGSLGRIVNPAYTDNGDLVFVPEIGAPYWNRLHRLLRYLPISDASDLSVETPEGRFMRPFAVVLPIDQPPVVGEGPLAEDSGWMFANHPPVDSQYAASGDITIHDRDGLIEIPYRPQHLLAGPSWEDDLDGEPPQFAYEPDSPADVDKRLVITICAETDTPPRVLVQTQAEPKDAQNKSYRRRKLVIEVPDAQVWLVCPESTVTGILGGRLLYHGGPRVVRDDTPRLRQVAALAKAWYGKRRAAVQVTYNGIFDLHPVGTMVLSTLDGDTVIPVNNVVSSREWDFQNYRCSLKTGFAELDVTQGK